MPDLSYLQNKSFTVVLVYDDGTEQGDWRLLPGIADWQGEQLVIHPAVDADDLRIPPSAYENIAPVTPELRPILGEAEYYVLLHIGPDPDAPKRITAHFIPFE